MSDPSFARHDLCSIRTANEQDELAKAVRGGFSADGYPLADDDPPAPLASGIDRAIRLSTAAAVLAVAGIAAYVSYGHAYAVVRAHGETGITARLEPATIDGLVYASSMVVLYAVRHRVPVPALARWLLALGIAATLTANMTQGWSHVLVVPAGVPANTVAELIAAAKAKPGELNIGFSLGTSPQILAEIFKSAAGAPLNSVPYRQVAQLNADILAGRLQAWFTAGAGSISLIQQGKLKALAYTGATRHPALPQVPTMIESGLPQLALGPSDWTGLVAPAATPKDAVDKLNAAIGASLRSPAVNASITQQGYEPMIRSPQELAAFLAAEATKWPPLVKAIGMQPE